MISADMSLVGVHVAVPSFKPKESLVVCDMSCIVCSTGNSRIYQSQNMSMHNTTSFSKYLRRDIPLVYHRTDRQCISCLFQTARDVSRSGYKRISGLYLGLPMTMLLDFKVSGCLGNLFMPIIQSSASC